MYCTQFTVLAGAEHKLLVWTTTLCIAHTPLNQEVPEVCIRHDRTIPQTADALLVACLERSRSCLTDLTLNEDMLCNEAWFLGQQI